MILQAPSASYVRRFEPTPEQIAPIHDCAADGITLDQFSQIVKNEIWR